MRVQHDRGDLLHLLLGKFTSALVDVNVGLAANQEGIATANSLEFFKINLFELMNLDGRERKRDFAITINVRVHHTMNMLELLGHNQRHFCFVILWKCIIIRKM